MADRVDQRTLHPNDWLITPLAPGSPLDGDGTLPANLTDTLARLHARYLGGDGLSPAIPRVHAAWWRSLCLDWLDPRLREYAGRHPRRPGRA